MAPELPFPKSAGDPLPPARTSFISGDHRTIDTAWPDSATAASPSPIAAAAQHPSTPKNLPAPPSPGQAGGD
jgi:hypothetical protein